VHFRGRLGGHLAPAFKSDDEPFQSILTIFSVPFVQAAACSSPIAHFSSDFPVCLIASWIYETEDHEMGGFKSGIILGYLIYVLPVTDDNCSSLVAFCTDLQQFIENVASLFLN
jgi:hypothetical protein